MSDVTFIVGKDAPLETYSDYLEGKELSDGKLMKIPAHTLILVQRSSYFRNMLAGDFKEKETSIIKIPNYKSEVFLAALKYLYAGDLHSEELFDNGTDVGSELMLLADQYGIESLHRLCESLLCRYINYMNVCYVCNCADKSNSIELKRYCVDFISEHLSSILETDGFHFIYESNPTLVFEVLHQVAEQTKRKPCSGERDIGISDLLDKVGSKH